MVSNATSPYANAAGHCLFQAVLDVYDRWLAGVPYVGPQRNGGLLARSQPELAREVWPAVEQLCIRMEANGKGELASRIERAYHDAEDYARIIDDYCLSKEFDYRLWAYGDPECDRTKTVNADLPELLKRTEAIGEGGTTANRRSLDLECEWACGVGERAAAVEVEKYGSTPTKDYAVRTAMRARACFWLAVQLHRRGMDYREASQYLETYLSSQVVVSETKYPVIHEALGRAFGMSIYPIAVLELEEVARNLENFNAVVMETKKVLVPPLAPVKAPPDTGEPFFKPLYFRKWVSDELLRRNATADQQYVAGKVRRVNRQTVRGRKPVYWYSEPDVRKRWPDRFQVAPKSGPRS